MNDYAIVVDDDPNTTSALSRIVQSHGYSVDTANSIQSARELYSKKKPKLMLVDVMLPDGNGVELIEELQSDPSIKFVVITGHASVKIAIQAIKAHAYDFLEKPVELSEIRKLLKKIDCTHSNSATNNHKTAINKKNENMPLFLGQSKVIDELRSTIDRVASSKSSIFLQGESGTGKEVVARNIHVKSGRTGEFVAVNCGSITRDLAASELFGHEKGSFTGASRQHIGYFERAQGGTILLDEITEMPFDLQVHLLRVLETSSITRLGGKHEIDIDVRVISACNRVLEDAIKEGKLREDLYFRLAEFPIKIPPLRSREHDAVIIAKDVLKALNDQHDTHKILTEETIDSLLQYPWPGNVRELKNVIQRAFLLSGNRIDWKTVFSKNPIDENIPGENPSLNISEMIGKSFWEIEKDLIYATLDHHNGDKENTAKTLGISLKTLYNRLHAYS